MAYNVRNPQAQSPLPRDLIDRWMESALSPWGATLWTNPAGSVNTFPVDIYDTPESYVVLAVIPGVNPDDVQVTSLNGVLTIGYENKPSVAEGARPLYREITYGQFRRDIRLPGDFALDQSEAVYDGGVLKLTLPKAEHIRPKSLRVKAASKN